jgi:hypothetical protein
MRCPMAVVWASYVARRVAHLAPTASSRGTQGRAMSAGVVRRLLLRSVPAIHASPLASHKDFVGMAVHEDMSHVASPSADGSLLAFLRAPATPDQVNGPG